MQELTRENPSQVLDLLTARCVFERNGVALYDAAIAKIERGAEPRYMVMLDQLRQIRAEEKEHEEWLEARIREHGGDPAARTTMAQLEEEEARGIKGVLVNGHQNVGHLLHALVAAELSDNAGWDLLLALARKAGDRRATREIGRRLAQEAKHLAYLREALHTLAAAEVLGEEKELPRSLPRALARKKPMVLFGLAGLAGLLMAGWKAMRSRQASSWRRVRAVV